MRDNITIENAVRAAERGVPAIVTVKRIDFKQISQEITRRLLAKNLNPDVVLYSIK